MARISIELRTKCVVTRTTYLPSRDAAGRRDALLVGWVIGERRHGVGVRARFEWTSSRLHQVFGGVAALDVLFARREKSRRVELGMMGAPSKVACCWARRRACSASIHDEPCGTPWTTMGCAHAERRSRSLILNSITCFRRPRPIKSSRSTRVSGTAKTGGFWIMDHRADHGESRIVSRPLCRLEPLTGKPSPPFPFESNEPTNQPRFACRNDEHRVWP